MTTALNGLGTNNIMRLLMNNDRPFIRWQEIRINQLTFVNNILIILSTGMLGFQIQFGISFNVQQSVLKYMFIVSMVFFFISILTGIFVALNRLVSFRKTAKIARNKEKKLENEKLCKEVNKLDKRTWFFLLVQSLFFISGIIVLLIFSILEIMF